MAALQLLDHLYELALVLIVLYFSGYVIYQRWLHPLAKYPGPFLASLTDLWQVHQFMTLKQPYTLTDLHEKHGSVVRYGPDKLSITSEEAIKSIYQSGARYMPKTEFYDAYGAAHPNVFGMRDENKALHYYVIDTLGELAFSQTFGVQESNDETRVPPVIEHSLLAAVTGAWPMMTARLKRWLPLIPHKGLQALFEGRKACANLASQCVNARLNSIRSTDASSSGSTDRKDILTNLILAKHPDTGESLSRTDLETEAFGFIIAGTHTTSATTALLFYHLLHHPNLMAQCVSEIDEKLPILQPHESAYPVSMVETSLPYLRNCMKENFRITPVFTMPLARKVLMPQGIDIAGNHIPYATSIAVCNHAFHHNPEIWGSDHNIFDPSRWEGIEIAGKSKLLMHFGLGGRQCIGKTVAMTNIYKLMSTLLSEFEFELADENERALAKNNGFVGQIPELISVGISDLARPLLVKVQKRDRVAAH
ncbi:uncharacterized protein N7477_009597 [Penicillium maclennaniae]|uniref:uncharacterized protein n=1 Tax=Penicillium maclennaniae TaxID=1343394 RepID=UPI00253F9C12|nr:uncharacterized protein N7477_009597 [Penicillium maclennaniae]KAJ5661981.1 hypothetical protein N7477_009597 [Penicillium maclennaniae]